MSMPLSHPRRRLKQLDAATMEKLCRTSADILVAAERSLLDSLSRCFPLVASSRGHGFCIQADPDKHEINLDVQHFSPAEISVKTVDGFVVVECKHKEKQDEHGYVSRQFVRKYALPEDALGQTVRSELSSDGVLTITVSKKGEETIVPITRTGPVRKVIKNDMESVDEKPKTE